MPTLNEYFRDEAREFLRVVERALGAPAPDASELHRAARALRGSAQMAREERFFRAASAFESVTRSLAAGALIWSAELTEQARATVADLRALLDPNNESSELDARAEAAARRWHGGAESQPAAAPRPPAEPDAASREFREFTAREVASIADTIDQGIQSLHADPMDREPLRTILRRQRALLGAARLDEVPVVAEILRAVEDLTRVIAKLDVGVKQEWLDIYRVARDGLQATIATLVRGGNPEPSHSVSRLRHMRAELLERYGEGEAVSAAHESQLVQATPMHAPGTNGHVHRASQDDETQNPGDAQIVEEPATLELAAADVIEEPATLDLEMDDAVEEAELLELEMEEAVDESQLLELDMEEAVDEPPLLELDMEEAVDEPQLLELDMEEAVDEPQLLELDMEEAVDEPQLLELEMSAMVKETPAEQARARAAELRMIMERVVSHDPQARAALEELYQLLDSALE